MSEVASLTRHEAEERAGLITVGRYDIAVDMRDLFEGETLHSTSTITFTCHQPGASTFVDCVAEIHEATLNGQPVDLSGVDRGRLPLTDLAAENVLVVRASQSDTGSGSGILRTVDPSDKLVYVWTSFEPDAARRVWACFDQPDLKAPHGFAVSAHETWTVTSNNGADSVEPLDDGGRLWTFPDTPPLSTYVVVVNAGPFHEIREERGGYSLGLYSRQSTKAYLERDAQDLLGLTAAGLAFFGERFGQPFPQERYDQVFVPNMGGAMENWGCVTWTDSVLWRSTPTYGQRAIVASVLLHEMAHMWFGDLVTMQWWDDLWLNEAFASWAATWGSAHATEFTDAWAAYLAGSKIEGYRIDMGPATHPIRGDVPDVAQAMANFDAITYVKGEATLKQLVAYVGEDAFIEGLRAYFRDHAWGNTRLHDLMSAVGQASGRDLDGWTSAWFDRAGTDTLMLDGDSVLATSPDGESPRPHRIDIGSYAVSGEALRHVGTTPVETSGVRTDLEAPLPEADLHLVNDDDLTFAAVRTDEASLRTMLDHAGSLPTPIARTLAVTTAWDMLVNGELAADDVLTCVLGVLGTERSEGIVEPFLGMAQRTATRWTAGVAVPAALARLADTAAALVEVVDLRSPALKALAVSATTEAHFALLERHAGEDLDLQWRILWRRSVLGDIDEAAVEGLLERDPNPDAWVSALTATAARGDQASKDEVWAQLFDKRAVPASLPMLELCQQFWQVSQADLLLPYAHRWLDELDALDSGGMLNLGGLIRATAPTVGDDAFVARAQELAATEGRDPSIRAQLLSTSDTMARMLRARG